MKTVYETPAKGEEFVLQTDQAPEFWQFLNGLRGDDLLVELIVNELDANSSRTEIGFEPDRLTCQGTGDPIDDLGWERLAYIKGAGLEVSAKTGLFGVKNHGLKACFTIGNEILLRSAGQQILQTLFGRGSHAPAYPSVRVPPRQDQDAPDQGTRIEVPYRRTTFSVPHGEAFQFAAVSDADIELVFQDAVATLPERLLGIMRPGMLDRYTLVLKHHTLGKRIFEFSAGRVRRHAGTLTFFRECNEVRDEGLKLLRREQACLALATMKSPTKPRFFQARSYSVAGKRLFSADGLVVEAAWPVDANGKLLACEGRLRYPVAYPGHDPASGTGMKVHYSGPFVSDTERHELGAQSKEWNEAVISSCDLALTSALIKQLLPKHGSRALELIASLPDERLVPFVNRLLTARALPVVDRNGKSARQKRGAMIIVPAYEDAVGTWAPPLAKVAPDGLPIIDPKTPSQVLSLLASNRCKGWNENHLRFDAQDVLNRLEKVEADWFPWRSSAERNGVLGDPSMAHAHLDAIYPFLAASTVAERPIGVAACLPDAEQALHPLSALRRGASVPTAVLGLDVPPLLHPDLRKHGVLKLEGWKVENYTLRDLVTDGRLSEKSVAVRKRFFAWLASNPDDLTRDDWPAVKASPIWPSTDGSVRKFHELCSPEKRLGRLLDHHIAKPSREVVSLCKRLSRSRVKLDLRREPQPDEIRNFYQEALGAFPTDRPLGANERKAFRELENSIAAAAESKQTKEAFKGLRDQALALNMDGWLRPILSVVRSSPDIERLALQTKDILDRPSSALDSIFPPSRKPTAQMSLDALRDDLDNEKALLPRLAVITPSSDVLISAELASLPCLPHKGRLAAPADLSFKGNAGEFWGGWKSQIGAGELSDVAQGLYRAAGVIRGNPTPQTSREYFAWLRGQGASVASQHIGCIMRHLHDPSGVGAWILLPPELPCIPVEVENGVELLTLSEARRTAVVNDLQELGEAIRVEGINQRLRLAIDSVAGVTNPVADELRAWGIPTLSSLAKVPINPSGANPEIAETNELARVHAIATSAASQRFRKQLKELDVPQTLIEAQFPSRLLAIKRIVLASNLSVQFRVRGRHYRASRPWAVLDSEIWIDREGDIEGAIMEAIADIVFRRPRLRYLSSVLKEALQKRARDFRHVHSEVVEDDNSTDEEPGDDELPESSKPHPGSAPDPKRNDPKPGDIYTGRGSKPSQSKGTKSRSKVAAEDIQRRDLKLNHYASHCQMELARRKLEELAPPGSYAEFAENRIRMLEAHHPDKTSTSGARHAGNLLVLSKVNHDAIGTRLTRADITKALKKRWKPHEILRSDGTTWLKGGIAEAIDKVTGETFAFFFTAEHRSYWLKMAAK